ncbi:Ribonuclease H [Apilactobacillus kunkeei]|nr:Ribonuclease H [Apilactobacillus kunkeei]CAI2647364.1 Ribonuclease H [Apilactobacillus kunkeei]CAI2647632.1 Ribonuclease H [Apilactobacillus kunkeei]CAI2647807.1 Ribonuclease H [Apilactobacillus kunkeei]CAI2648295.1 Ribonuclease H [Apilactobacillus kunkeei]
MASKFYAVRKGKKPGIYSTWDECKNQVNGFPGAEYKSFKTKLEANAYMGLSQPAKNIAPKITRSGSITLYSDGGSRNHGNKLGQHVKDDDKAAWAYLIIKDGKKHYASDGEFGATNNKMEVLGLVNALQYIIEQGWQNESINAILDSKYVLDSITKGWLNSWRRRGWKKSDGTIIKNKNEFMQLSALLGQFKHLNFKWTKGHADNSGNNFVDKLLNEKMDDMKLNQPNKTIVHSTFEQPKTEEKSVEEVVKLYAHGKHINASGNQYVDSNGPSVWAYCIDFDDELTSNSGGMKGINNSKMQLLSVINGLKKLVEIDLNSKQVEVITPSLYISQTINDGKLAYAKAHDWQSFNGEVITNVEEIKQLAEVLEEFKTIKFVNSNFDNNDKAITTVQQLLDDEIRKIDSDLAEQLKPKQKVAEPKPQPKQPEKAKEYIDKDKSVSDIEKSLRDLGFFDK